MWNRISLRIKLTILTALALSLLTACITAISIFNARRNFVIPLENFEMERTENVMFSGSFFHEQIEPGGIFDDTLNHRYTVTFFVNRSQSNFQTQSVVIAVVFILLGALGAFVLSGRALKPIKSLAEKIEDIDVNNLSTQIKPPQTSDETSRLTHSFNHMLMKLNRSFENQKLFAQNAAHELKTPLSSIMTNIEVLQLDDEPTADEYKEVVDAVKISTQRLIELVKGLLSLNSVLDKTECKPINVRRMIEMITLELQEPIAEKGLCITISGDCQWLGNQALLERAFFNLIHNAVRYNNENGQINVNLTPDCISIEDSGIGIPEENLQQIFEPFYCVDSSRSKELGGHGLGLAIAKNIFDKHDIKISITSELGKGTKIILKTQKN